MTALVFSVHADDGIFSCGEWIASQTVAGCEVRVASLCSEAPWHDEEARQWQGTLNIEHYNACRLLGASATFVGFVDGKWPSSRWPNQIVPVLTATATREQARTVLVPLGIHHPDHLFFAPLLLEAAIASGARVAVYEDLPYRAMYPEEAALRRNELIEAFGRNLESAAGSGFLGRKLEACAAYVSQWGEDAQRHCCVYERLWWL